MIHQVHYHVVLLGINRHLHLQSAQKGVVVFITVMFKVNDDLNMSRKVLVLLQSIIMLLSVILE